MKQSIKSLLALFTLFLVGYTQLQAQWIPLGGPNAWGRNNYLEVGLGQCGVYGTSVAPPPGYHPNAGFAPGLGFVCDYQRNGWAVAAAGGFNYCGDYFVPGSPVEGWSLTFNGVDYINSDTYCPSFAIPGAISKWVDTPTIDTMEWSGAVAGVSVLQRTLIPNDSLFFVTEVVICNTTASTVTGVYYGRNLDPDNEQPWTGSFTTSNVVVSQPAPPVTSDALVTSIGGANQCFLGLGARDDRARVNHGGFGTVPADDLYFGVGRVTTIGTTTVADEGNGIGFSLGDLAPGECTCLSFVYVMSASMLGSALSATVGITITADTTTIPVGGNAPICLGDSVTISLGGSAASYTWTWSPPYGLSDTTGLSVIASPDTTTTYTVTGNAAGFACGASALTFTVVVDTPFADAGPDLDGCPGGSVVIGLPPNPGEIYSWTPTGPITGSPTTTPTTVSFPAAGTYPFELMVIDTTSGCVAYDTMNVHIIANPPPSFNLANEICVGSPTTITYTGDTTGSPSYIWTIGPTAVPAAVGGPGPHVVTWITPGLKYVTLTMVFGGCTTQVAIDSIMVWAYPEADITPFPNQCFEGNNFDFSNGGTYDSTAAFYWTFGPDAVPPFSTDEFPTGVVFLTDGPKLVTLQVSQHGCITEVDSVNFIVYPQPNPAWTQVGGVQCFAGNSYDFNAVVVAPTISYDWTFQDGSPVAASGPNPTGISFISCGFKAVSLTVTQNGCSETLVDTIQVFCDPTVDAGPAASFCESEGGAQLTGTAFGGTPPYYWTWWCATPPCGIDSVFDDDPWVNPDVSGYYYTQVTDFNGCVSNIDSVWVTVIPKPIVDAGADIYLCAAPSPCEMLNPTVTGSPGPFSYVWSPALGLSNAFIANPCARPDTTTAYTLVVTDLTTGCTSVTTTTDTLSTVVVHVVPVPIADAGPDRDMCEGESIMLLGLGYGAGPSYAYEWSPFTPPVSLSANNIPNPIAFPNITTNYVLTVWSNGCPSFGDTVVVNVHTNPTVDGGPDRDICQGESALLDGSAWGDLTSTFYTFEWWDPSSLDDALLEDPTATPDTTTMYYVQATSEYGCESPLDSVLVQVKPSPLAEAGNPINICQGDTVQLDGSFYYSGTIPVGGSTVWHTWTPPTNISNDTVWDPLVWPTSTMYYVLTIQQNTCTSTDSVLVTVSQTPQVVVDGDTTVTCEGDSVQLLSSGGLGGATVLWTPSIGLSDPTAANPMASPPTTTTYTVNYQEGMCTGDAQITVTVIPTPQMAYMSSQTTGCAPLTVSFLETTSDAISYLWEFGDGSISNELTPVHTYEKPGTYVVTLTATNFGGCEGSISTITIVVTDPGAAEFTTDPGFPVDLSLPNTNVQFIDMSQQATSWIWNFGDGSVSTVTNPTHSFTSEGEFMVTLTVTSADGCVSEVVHGPFVVRAPDLFIPNVFSPNDDGINDEWIVRYTGDQPFSADVFDRWGTKYYQSTNKMGAWKGTGKNGAAVPEGVYYYRINIGDKEFAGEVTLIR